MDRSRQRIDKWLFCARAVKSRTLAASLVEAGHVRLNGRRIKAPAQVVGAGDVLTIALERQVRVWRVVSTSERRGPFSSACLLYEDIGLPDAREPASPGCAPGERLLAMPP